jgi:hypothetical protein
LATFSEASLESFELSRMNLVANLRKELHQLVDEWIEAEIESRIARWILEGRGTRPIDAAPTFPEPSTKPLAGPPSLPGPSATTPGGVGSPTGAGESDNKPLLAARQRQIPRRVARRPSLSNAAKMATQSSLFPALGTCEDAPPPAATLERTCETLKSLEHFVHSRGCTSNMLPRVLPRRCSSRMSPSGVVRRCSFAHTSTGSFLRRFPSLLVCSSALSFPIHLE